MAMRQPPLGQEVGLGRHVLPARLEACSPELVQHQLQVGGGVFKDQDVERCGHQSPMPSTAIKAFMGTPCAGQGAGTR
jgi:hypothetical protein